MNLFSPLVAKILAGVSAVLLLAVVVQSVRLNVTQGKLEKCELGRAADRKAYAAAAAQAEVKALAQKQAVEATYRAKAEEADNDYQTALARAQRASDAYAARMRIKALGGASGGTSTPAPSDDPRLPAGAPEPTILVSQRDFDICTENSVKIDRAWSWAKTLNVEPIPDVALSRKSGEP